MNFSSDNVAGIAPEFLEALARANAGAASPYGADALSQQLVRRFAEIFEHEVAVFPVATGTAANALALAAVTPPWGVIYCHEDSHIATDECGAPEFYTGGAKLIGLAGNEGKITAAAVASRLGERGVVHHAQPAAISLTQATEAGTLYRPDEIAEIGSLARRHGLALHLDGARFANAVAALGCAPADMTWRVGVDVLDGEPGREPHAVDRCADEGQQQPGDEQVAPRQPAAAPLSAREPAPAAPGGLVDGVIAGRRPRRRAAQATHDHRRAARGPAARPR